MTMTNEQQKVYDEVCFTQGRLQTAYDCVKNLLYISTRDKTRLCDDISSIIDELESKRCDMWVHYGGPSV